MKSRLEALTRLSETVAREINLWTLEDGEIKGHTGPRPYKEWVCNGRAMGYAEHSDTSADLYAPAVYGEQALEALWGMTDTWRRCTYEKALGEIGALMDNHTAGTFAVAVCLWMIHQESIPWDDYWTRNR